MAMKPNYRQERLSRERTRDAKKQEKLRRREEDSQRRKALRSEREQQEPEGDPTA
jgi:hypothetical protein